MTVSIRYILNSEDSHSTTPLVWDLQSVTIRTRVSKPMRTCYRASNGQEPVTTKSQMITAVPGIASTTAKSG